MFLLNDKQSYNEGKNKLTEWLISGLISVLLPDRKKKWYVIIEWEFYDWYFIIVELYSRIQGLLQSVENLNVEI